MTRLSDEQVESYLQQAIALATANVKSGKGGPFGAVIVFEDKVVSTGVNTVVAANDPTAHAEVNAIRTACHRVSNFRLDDCILFASCEPCPMCLAATYWARIPALYYAASKDDASVAGFDDGQIWREMMTKPADRLLRMKRIVLPTASQPFKAWDGAEFKLPY
jgi:guanine deaminase